MTQTITPRPVPRPAPPAMPPSPPPEFVDPARPLPAGQPVFSEETRKYLLSIGWKDGDPLPGEIGQRLAQLQAEIAAAAASIPERPTTPVRPSKIVDITELPPEQQKELQELVDRVKGADGPPQSTAPGSIFETVGSDHFSDTLTLTPPASTPDKASATPDAGESAAKPDEVDAGAKALPTVCPRCFYDLSQPFTVKPTDQDKQAFVASMLGAAVFKKHVTLLNGQLGFTFRELTPEEADLVLRQCHYDMLAGTLDNEGQYLAAVLQYRLCLSLQQIWRKGVVALVVPPITDHAAIGYTPDPKTPSTPLPALQRWVFQHVLVNESLRRLAALHHQQFQRLIEALEAMTHEPDFWSGIG